MLALVGYLWICIGSKANASEGARNKDTWLVFKMMEGKEKKMSVIAWDGKTLAADKLGCMGSLKITITKIFCLATCLVGYVGEIDAGEELVDWFSNGAVPGDFPAGQRNIDKSNWLLVIAPDKSIKKYERTPFPITIEDPFFAMGSGRDYAMAAMYLGKTAREAVEIACIFDNGCGNGVDVFAHPKG